MDTIVTPVTVITLDSTRIVHSIKADLVTRYFPPVVRLVQYDQSLPVIAVSLMQNGQAYTLPSGAAANIRVHKPDATYVYNPALGCDSTRNIVYFEVTQAMAAANGDGLAIVEIVVDGDIAGTSLITLHFEENPVPEDAIESSDEWETIYELGERIIASTVTPVSTAAGMTDHNVVYLYTGTESGWNQGHMYYYNGTAWVDAGIAVTDTTLSVAGLAADAKKTGDEIADLKDGINNSYTFEWIANGWVNYSNGVVVTSPSYHYSDFLPVYDNQSIRTYINIAGNAGIAFYDTAKKYISGYQAETSGLRSRITPVPSSAKYVRLSCFSNDVTNAKTKVIEYTNISAQINHATDDIIDLQRIIGNAGYSTLELDVELGIYNSAGGISADSGFHVFAEVREGEKYLVTGQQISSWFPLGGYYNNGSRVSTIDAGTTGAINDHMLIIPSGVNQIEINGIDTQLPSVKKYTSANFAQQLYEWYVVSGKTSSGSVSNTLASVDVGNHMTVQVEEGQHYKISGARWSDYVPSYVISNGTSAIAYETGRTEQYFTDLEITIPEGGKVLYINGNAVSGLKCIRYGRVDYARQNKNLSGKTMVWFGTSIPQNSTYFEGNNWSIPTYAGKILGMNVINECYGASIAARGIYNHITANDPYGWTGTSWYAVFRALGANLTEKQDLIDNYESKWYALLGGSTDPLYVGAKPQTLTDALKAEILSCSYENRLMPYINGSKTMPDLFVFEHGYNDSQATTFSGISPDENNLNRSLYSDAMYFFFQKIFEANPQAKILVVSHYENTSATGKKTFDAQKELAEYHGLYFCDVANNVGWSQRLVKTTGYWDNGIWNPSGGTERTITRLAQCIPDQVHPHTDKSGNAVKREAQIVADFIAANVNLD